MASADQVRALVQSHFDGDQGRFMSVAMQVAAGEARKGHTEFSDELRRMIEKAKNRLVPQQTAGETIPFAAARGELGELFAVFHPQTKLADMVLPEAMQARMANIPVSFDGVFEQVAGLPLGPVLVLEVALPDARNSRSAQ